MYKVYVLRSKSGKTYIGQSKDTENRLAKHNRHSSKATRSEIGWKVVYEETHYSRSVAVKRERFFKSGDGKRVLVNKGLLPK